MGMVLGIDLGTTNVKACLYTEAGVFVDSGSEGYGLLQPREGWKEQNPQAWWRATCLAIRRAVGNRKSQVHCLAVSSQAPSLTPVDADFKPLRNALIWMDTRADSQCAALKETIGRERYHRLNGADPDPYYLLPKLLWFRENEPRLFEKTAHVLTTNGYINARLTGQVGLDFPQAALLTHCYDLKTQTWSSLISQKTGLPLTDLFPRLMQPWDLLGRVSAQAAEETGLQAGTAVLCGTADGLAAQLEAGLTQPGTMSLTLGTSSMLLYALGGQPAPGTPLMPMAQPFGLAEVPYILSASVNTAGAAAAWSYQLLENRDTIDDEFEAQAAHATPGSGGLMFLPTLAGERAPLWNRRLSGAFIGLTLQTGRSDMYRALLEGTAFAALYATQAAAKAGFRLATVRAGGAGARNRLWVKIHASMLRQPVHVALHGGGAPMGDAMLACFALARQGSLTDVMNRFLRTEETEEPVAAWETRYEALYPLFCQAQHNLAPCMERLHDLSAQWEGEA